MLKNIYNKLGRAQKSNPICWLAVDAYQRIVLKCPVVAVNQLLKPYSRNSSFPNNKRCIYRNQICYRIKFTHEW